MADFRVVWEIDIEADTPEEAAREALRIQRKQGTATVFDVIGDFGAQTRVDLTAIDEEQGL